MRTILSVQLAQHLCKFMLFLFELLESIHCTGMFGFFSYLEQVNRSRLLNLHQYFSPQSLQWLPLYEAIFVDLKKKQNNKTIKNMFGGCIIVTFAQFNHCNSTLLGNGDFVDSRSFSLKRKSLFSQFLRVHCIRINYLKLLKNTETTKALSL